MSMESSFMFMRSVIFTPESNYRKGLKMLRRAGYTVVMIVATFVLVLLPQKPTLAATYTIGDAAGLATAITEANTIAGADTILLNANIVLTAPSESSASFGDTGLPPITSNITIEGQGHSITRSGAAADFRLLRVASGGSLTLLNLTLSNGIATPGSACFTFTSSCGGAIHNEGTLSITNTLISSNHADDWGGGISNTSSGTITVTNSTFAYNSTTAGGGIYNKGTVTVNSSVFSNNSAFNGGGGLYQDTGSAPSTIRDTTFSNNSTSFYGGAVQSVTTLTISGSTFTGNSANVSGGAIHTDAGSMTVINSTISGNTAGGGGGGGISNVGTITVINSTLSGNINSFSGNVVNNGTATFQNSIISKGGATPTNCSNFATFTAVFSQADDTTCPGFTNSPSLNLGALTNNSGNTQTIALLSGSSAIDAADNTVCSGAPVNTFDQRGVGRGIDGDGTANSPQTGDCDIGAFEASAIIPAVQFDAPSSQTAYSPGAYPVTLSLSTALPASSASIQVYIWVSSGTAVAGTNYTPFGVQTVTFNPGDTTKVINVNLLSAPISAARSITLSIATQYGPGYTGPAQQGNQLSHVITLVPISPPNATPEVNYFDGTNTPTLTWNRVANATGYEIQVDTDKLFALPYAFPAVTVSGDILSIDTDPLANGIYYWRVRALYPNNKVGAWSTVQQFEVAVP